MASVRKNQTSKAHNRESGRRMKTVWFVRTTINGVTKTVIADPKKSEGKAS
jgi:hypothetical protein